MKIITLMENSPGKACTKCEHGLSLYIETGKHKIIMDTGASDATWQNAEVLGVDLTDVDTVVISHGHYDHAGGLLTFALSHPGAAVYLQKSAAGDFFDAERYIGIDRRILDLPNLRLIEGDLVIDEEIKIFTGITGRKHWPEGNLLMKEKVDGELVQDSFVHEQCLVVTDEVETALISGCAHNGILNIMEKYVSLYGDAPDKVVSGFHMMKKTEHNEKEKSVIKETAHDLLNYPSIYYTGHCTGQPAFDMMKVIMGDRLIQLYTGFEF